MNIKIKQVIIITIVLVASVLLAVSIASGASDNYMTFLTTIFGGDNQAYPAPYPVESLSDYDPGGIIIRHPPNITPTERVVNPTRQVPTATQPVRATDPPDPPRLPTATPDPPPTATSSDWTCPRQPCDPHSTPFEPTVEVTP